MRIAILTLPLHTNYGGILQAYALQTTLERMGHEVKVLSPKQKRLHPPIVMPLVYFRRFVQRYILRKDVAVRYDGRERPRQYTDKFIKKYIHILEVSNLQNTKGLFDAYVVGSDQIWRPKYANWFPGIKNVFLGFAENWNVKKIAYAASFGTDEWEFSEDETMTCKKLAHTFDAISTREISGVKLCNEHLGIKAECLLDPTFLLTKNNYSKLIENYKEKSDNAKGKLITYILDEDDRKNAIASEISNHFSMEIYRANSKVEDWNSAPREKIQPPVENWLNAIMDAGFVITDSFHACVFSILFHKEFLVFLNESRGSSRIKSLLETFGLQERIIDGNRFTSNNIDFRIIDTKLSVLKEHALSFLYNNLS